MSKVAVSMILVGVANVEMATTGRREGNGGGGILDTMKILLHRLPCWLGCKNFPFQTAHAMSMILVIGDLQQCPPQVGAAALEALALAVLLKYES
jgi:hypothetical protein